MLLPSNFRHFGEVFVKHLASISRLGVGGNDTQADVLKTLQIQPLIVSWCGSRGSREGLSTRPQQQSTAAVATLTKIKSVLDELLQNCALEFGDITIVVKKGQLEKTVFSYSTRPNESSKRHFGKI
jgi:hypothetical protein